MTIMTITFILFFSFLLIRLWVEFDEILDNYCAKKRKKRNKMKTYEFEENLKQLNLEVRIFRDGDQWCACYSNFVDIQESVCAFGDNCIQALEALIKEERNK